MQEEIKKKNQTECNTPKFQNKEKPFFQLSKNWSHQKLAFFIVLCIVTMRISCLDGLQTLIKPKINNNKIKDKQSNGKEK